MDAITEILNRVFEQLFGRAGGMLSLRLFIQPTVAGILAIRAGIKDARDGTPPFFWTVATTKDPEQRRTLIRSGMRDLSKLFILAMVLDTIYQVVVFRAFFVVQALIVSFVVIIPYILLRGVVRRIADAVRR